MNAQAPTLYGLPKIHKEDIPMRPVVSYINAPSYKLCKLVKDILPELIEFKPERSVINSLELINKIKDTQIPISAKLVSFDVKSLFTYIPINDLRNILTSELTNHNITNKTELTDLIDICLNQNYFEFNGEFYKQSEGLPMGSPLSPLLSEIYMNHFENELFTTHKSITSPIAFWHRYVDDIVCLWTGSDRQLDIFLKTLNRINSNIQFTMEKENENSLNFLDLKITRIVNKLDFAIYRKETFCDTVIPNDSNHPNNIKVSAYNSMVFRLLNVPMTNENYLVELNDIKNIAINNGYNSDLIDHIVHRMKKNIIMKLIYPCTNNPRTDDKKWVRIPFLGNLSYKLKNFLSKRDYKVAYYNNTNIGSVLINTKLNKDKFNKSGIYQIKCNNCDKLYVGQTGRSFKIRFEEHMRSYRLQKDNSSVANHLIETGHKCNINNLKILHTGSKGHKLNFLESYYIKRENLKNPNNILNDHLDLMSTPLLYPLTSFK